MLRLADEEPVIHEALNSGDSTVEFCGCWANDSDGTQVRIEEMGRLGHDEVGLQRIAVEGLGIRLALGSRERRERYGCARAARSVVRVGLLGRSPHSRTVSNG